MKTHKSNRTGIICPRDGELNYFRVEISIDIIEGVAQPEAYKISFWPSMEDVWLGLPPNAERSIAVGNVNETADKKLSALLRPLPYALTGETLDLSGAVLVEEKPKKIE